MVQCLFLSQSKKVTHPQVLCVLHANLVETLWPLPRVHNPQAGLYYSWRFIQVPQMRTAERNVRVQVLIDVVDETQCASNDHTAQAMPDETDPCPGSEVDILKVTGKLDCQSLAHCLDVVISAAFVCTADEDLGLEVDLETKFENLEVLPRCLVPMNEHNDVLSLVSEVKMLWLRNRLHLRILTIRSICKPFKPIFHRLSPMHIIVPQLNMLVPYHVRPDIILSQSDHWWFADVGYRGSDELLLKCVSLLYGLFLPPDRFNALGIVVVLLQLWEWS